MCCRLGLLAGITCMITVSAIAIGPPTMAAAREAQLAGGGTLVGHLMVQGGYSKPDFPQSVVAGQALQEGGLNGGMVVSIGGTAAIPATVPSCRAITYRGNGGAIYVQTSPSGTVVWGIYMYNRELDTGPWTVDAYVGKRRVDHKSQNYAPHGSVNPVDAKKGAVFRITATHYATANQTWYHSVTNGCIIP
jgi:hypothetical protein